MTDPGRLAYFEWSVDEDAWRAGRIVGDEPEAWAQANPAFGTRISAEYIASEMAAMGGPRSETFARERLGIGTWPAEDGESWKLVTKDAWMALVDGTSQPLDPVMFAVDVTPDRDRAAIAVAGQRDDGLAHVEVIEHRPGTGWVVPRLAELSERWSPLGVVIDRRSPAGALYDEAERAGVPLTDFGTRDLTAACGQFVDAVANGTVRHLDQDMLTAALAGAQKRPLGEGAWALARRDLDVDICPLVAAVEALWAYLSMPAPQFFGADDDDDEEST